MYYRALADDDVFRLLRTLETVGHTQLADVQQVVQSYLDGRDQLEPVTFKELRRLMRDEDITVVDVRPADEYEAGHIPGALLDPSAGSQASTARAPERPRGDRVLPWAVLRVLARSRDTASEAWISRPARARGLA
jgi:rhodanese-related sulfurtransferase